MTDIATIWNPDTNVGDWQVLNGDLVMDGGLATAAIISLGTDRLANADDVLPDNSTDRRGWWGDAPIDPTVGGTTTYLIGSRLWLLARGKGLPQTAVLAQQIVTEAFQWMLDDGVAGAVNVTTQLASSGLQGAPTDRLYVRVQISQRGQPASAKPAYDNVWTVTLGGA